MWQMWMLRYLCFIFRAIWCIPVTKKYILNLKMHKFHKKGKEPTCFRPLCSPFSSNIGWINFLYYIFFKGKPVISLIEYLAASVSPFRSVCKECVLERWQGTGWYTGQWDIWVECWWEREAPLSCAGSRPRWTLGSGCTPQKTTVLNRQWWSHSQVNNM